MIYSRCALIVVVFALLACEGSEGGAAALTSGPGDAGGDLGGAAGAGPAMSAAAGTTEAGGAYEVGSSEATVTDADEDAVYAALLAQKHGQRFYVFNDTTRSEDIHDQSVSELQSSSGGDKASLMLEAVNNYLKRNKTSDGLRTSMNIGVDYALMSSSAFMRLGDEQQQDPWESLANLYPGTNGFSEISHVGFSADKQLALVYYGYTCSFVCGSGEFYLLAQSDGTWTVLGSQPVWMS